MRKWWLQRKLLKELDKLEDDIGDLRWACMVKELEIDRASRGA